MAQWRRAVLVRVPAGLGVHMMGTSMWGYPSPCIQVIARVTFKLISSIQIELEKLVEKRRSASWASRNDLSIELMVLKFELPVA